MVLLDTHYLIRCLIKDSIEARQVLTWLQTDKPLGTSSLCWYEFLCGPVTEKQISLVRLILQDNIFDFTLDTSKVAAQLWNATGRNRKKRIDTLIAACAIEQNAELATRNISDFKLYIDHGLRVVPEMMST